MSIRIIVALAFCALIASTADAQNTKKELRAAGQVETVSKESLTIVVAGDTKITLAVDKETKLSGPGLGEKTNGTQGSASLDTLVKPSASVVVTYSDVDGKLRATEVHVRQVTK
jgi:hypothetical protein